MHTTTPSTGSCAQGATTPSGMPGWLFFRSGRDARAQSRPGAQSGLRGLLPILALMLLATLAGGCAPHVSLVRVESAADHELFEPTEFTVVSGLKDMDTTSHAYRRYAQALAAELVRLGFTQAKTPETAHVNVILRFGLVGEKPPHQGRELEHLFVLDIEAVDAIAARAGRPTPTLWKVTATAHGRQEAIDTVYKSLLAASVPMIGKSGQDDLRVHRNPATGTYEFIPR
jgi:hypothetical protein